MILCTWVQPVPPYGACAIKICSRTFFSANRWSFKHSRLWADKVSNSLNRLEFASGDDGDFMLFYVSPWRPNPTTATITSDSDGAALWPKISRGSPYISISIGPHTGTSSLAASLHSILLLLSFPRRFLRLSRPEMLWSIRLQVAFRINGIYLPILRFHSSLWFSDQKPKYLFDYSDVIGGHLFHFFGFHRLGSWKVSSKLYPLMFCWLVHRRNLLLTLEGLSFLALVVLELLAQILPAVREDLGLFKAFDLAIGELVPIMPEPSVHPYPGISSFLPISLYSVFLYLLTNAEIVTALPHRIKKFTKLALALFIPAIVIFNEIASFIGVSIRESTRILSNEPVITGLQGTYRLVRHPKLSLPLGSLVQPTRNFGHSSPVSP